MTTKSLSLNGGEGSIIRTIRCWWTTMRLSWYAAASVHTHTHTHHVNLCFCYRPQTSLPDTCLSWCLPQCGSNGCRLPNKHSGLCEVAVPPSRTRGEGSRCSSSAPLVTPGQGNTNRRRTALLDAAGLPPGQLRRYARSRWGVVVDRVRNLVVPHLLSSEQMSLWIVDVEMSGVFVEFVRFWPLTTHQHISCAGVLHADGSKTLCKQGVPDCGRPTACVPPGFEPCTPFVYLSCPHTLSHSLTVAASVLLLHRSLPLPWLPNRRCG